MNSIDSISPYSPCSAAATPRTACQAGQDIEGAAHRLYTLGTQGGHVVMHVARALRDQARDTADSAEGAIGAESWKQNLA